MKREVTASISRSERRLIAGLIVLAALLRLFRLGAQSLWIDEMLTLIAATPKPGIPLGTLLLHNIHGPLHTFVVALMRTVSESEWWLRLPSAVAGVASVPLLYMWVRPRLGSRVATWAALLLAINPLHLHYSQELRNYAFAVCFVLLSCVSLDRLCERWSLRHAVAFSAGVAAAVLCNFSAVFAFVVQSIVFAKNTAPRARAVPRWLVVTAVVILITSPWIYRVTTFVDFGKLVTPVQPGALDPAELLRGDTTFRWESIPYTFYAYSVGFALGPSLAEMHGDLNATVAQHRAAIAWTAIVFGVLAAGGLVSTWRRSAWRGGELVLYIVVPLAATLALNWQNAKAFNVRYVLIGLPMFLTLVAAGIEAAGGKRRVAALALVVGTCLPALFNYYRDPARQKEDVRAAVRAVEARLQPGECIFAPTVFPIVAHYQTTSAPLHYIFHSTPEIVDRQMQGFYAAGCSSFWYVRARPWVDDPDGRVWSSIQSRYQAREELDFPGVRAVHFISRN